MSHLNCMRRPHEVEAHMDDPIQRSRHTLSVAPLDGMRACLRRILVMCCLLNLASVAVVYAAPTIGDTASKPTFILANTPTFVTVTSLITDPTLIPSTVVLQAVDEITGRVL